MMTGDSVININKYDNPALYHKVPQNWYSYNNLFSNKRKICIWYLPC
jgi:hypothetical protein